MMEVIYEHEAAGETIFRQRLFRCCGSSGKNCFRGANAAIHRALNTGSLAMMITSCCCSFDTKNSQSTYG